MFRITNARKEVGVDAKTLKKMGLTLFQVNGCIFGSKLDFENLVRTKGKQIVKKTEAEQPTT